MIPLILFVALGIVILIIFEVRARKERKNNSEQPTGVADLPSTESSANDLQQSDLSSSSDDGCCGEHLVCERETLLQTNAKVEYYDDEEYDDEYDDEEYDDEEYDEEEEFIDEEE